VWVEVLTPLTKKPGEWFRVALKDTWGAARSCASQLSTGRLDVPPGEWGFKSEAAEDGGGYVCARYVGP
jgi:hypothetical protein